MSSARLLVRGVEPGEDEGREVVGEAVPVNNHAHVVVIMEMTGLLRQQTVLTVLPRRVRVLYEPPHIILVRIRKVPLPGKIQRRRKEGSHACRPQRNQTRLQDQPTQQTSHTPHTAGATAQEHHHSQTSAAFPGTYPNTCPRTRATRFHTRSTKNDTFRFWAVTLLFDPTFTTACTVRIWSGNLAK